MESGITNESDPAVVETGNVLNTDSADSFQSFIYELFEKNGILNDLRAYLRGHIVNVLKSAETGDPPPCQKNFTQRLDLKYQALNMLVAEYLMRLEFNYSFSIFISEIPLANMVFGFAKTLMENIDENNPDLRFRDTDVWSILNYLGVQCDSEHASNIVQMYKNEKQQPLLLCILKSMPMYKECVVEPLQSLSEVSEASTKSYYSIENEIAQKINKCIPECSHYSYCKKCQNKMYKLRDDYKKKKKHFAKMFQQLKSVYESEVEMVKIQEEKKVKRSMATHAMQLQQKQNELEESFRAREDELERSIQHKKKFLWGLARSLREQHATMTRAMHDVRAETERLELKEDSLKNQLAEAEQILKQRGEHMRSQISNELAILERHLESMKRERENITRERSELENLKIEDKNTKLNKTHKMETEEVQSHYVLLKNELAILRSYLESSQMQAKCVIERGTITEPSETVSQVNVALNNSQDNDKGSKSDVLDERLKMNQVINDFRKKNVNFSQSNLDEIYHERTRERSRSENSSEAGDTAVADIDLVRARDLDLIHRLREENERLRTFTRQRGPQVCVAGCARCELLASRPHTAPSTEPANNVHLFNFNGSMSASTLNVGWRKGAGEELSMFSNAQPRILVPGDTLPFIGVLHDRHASNRRTPAGGSRGHMRAALAGVSKRTLSPFRERHTLGSSAQGMRLSGAHLTVASCSLQQEGETPQASPNRVPQRPRQPLSLENRIRDMSPRSLLRNAKDNLRKKDSNKNCSELPRDKSPTAVLREAKQRLRKLEIEAEAVEKSYLDFRRRQSELRPDRTRVTQDTRDDLANTLDATRSRSIQKLDETSKDDISAQFAHLQKSMRGDFDKYIGEYKTKFDITETHLRSQPIVVERGTRENENVDNYLETPLTEFRKLYTCDRHTLREDTKVNSLARTDHSASNDVSKTEFDYDHSARHDALRKVKRNRQAELKILKQNLNQMYHSPNTNSDSATTMAQQIKEENYLASAETEHNLRVEVENVSEINDIQSQKQDMLLVVQSSVNSREVTMLCKEPSEMFSAQMTIIVSPKRPSSDSTADECRRSQSPEQAAHLTRNDVLDAIFHADQNNDVSSVQMELELSKDDDDAIDDYPGDFVAEENESASEDEHSPISIPVTAKDDNFWDP